MAKNTSFGGTVKLTGESEYQKALSGITSSLKVLNSEMKVVTSQYDKNDKSTENLSQQNEVLNKKIAEQSAKVAVLANALADAEAETGENSDTTKKWQTELNNAKAELNKLIKNVDDNEKAMKDSEKATEDNADAIDKFGKEADEGGKSALKLGDIIKANLISEGIMAGIKGLGNAIKSVGSAFVDIGKQAIASYGEYEQLVGGVETLFGARGAKTVEEYAKLMGKSVDEVGTEFGNLISAQEQVLNNANNAYKTAGLSANEYMETVTSISASLIQGLDGDTVKAAELANVAITDMSDNANKMGTSMESIQNAYQGFAKQNYSMLDNLKLGYGGTQKEMYRLMQDAQKIDKDFDAVFSLDEKGHLTAEYADIVEAIHIIQKDMGILGTTSVEASGTITGSTASMKSAWQNLITGIADDNANFEQLVNNLVVSIVGTEEGGGVLSNILPRIETALDGIVQMVVSLTQNLLPQIMTMAVDLINTLVTGISENLPALLDSASTILNTLITGIVTILPTLIPIAMQMIMTLTTAILENLPMILDMGIKMLMSLVDGLTSMLPTLIPLAINAILNLVDTLLDNIDLIIDTGIELTLALADGLIYAMPDLIDKIPVIIEKLISAFITNFPKIVSAGGELIGKLAMGVIGSLWKLREVAPQLISTVVNGLVNGYTELSNTGKYLIQGLWKGISGMADWVYNQIKSFAKNIVGNIKDALGIHSPSTVFRDEVGKNLALGIGEGFADTMANVSADMQGAIPTEFDTSINARYNAGVGSSPMSNYDMMVLAFKQALTEVKVVMDDREMGGFVTNTIERAVFA